ncbi:VanW family protein [Jeotgalibacillus terrae]|uniref:VanW family protein n=1 Tax=Jeotgalibacillus terrae TaxID=587735 RepID=A0ABW5ZHS0_9BACL|nr:VanW family protein [Jeotgalibacillus terrae]MBM7578842.1 hypothetical protein [Jeotgalibacillus terrae]
MSQNVALKMLAVMLLSFVIIAGATQAGPALLPGTTSGEEVFTEGTMIGRTNVAGLTTEEAEAAVIEDILNWKQQSDLAVAYGDEQSVLSPELIEFFPSEAVQTAESGLSNPVPLNVKMGDVITLLSRDFGLPESDVLDPIKVQSEIESRIAYLQPAADDPIELESLLSSGTGETLIAEAAGTFTVTAGQQNYLFAHESVTLSPGQYYSVLNLSNQVIESVEDYEITDEELSKIATVVHTAVLDTPLTIAERHISTRLPEYATEGKEARVTSASGNDYKVMNATQSEFTISAESIQGTLYVRITGPEQPFTYQAEISETDVLPFRTVRQYSPFVADGAVEVTENGVDGQLIPVERVTFDADSYELEREFLYEDFYPPVHRVEVSSLETPEQLAEDDQSEDGSNPAGNDDQGSNGTDDNDNNGNNSGNNSGESSSDGSGSNETGSSGGNAEGDNSEGNDSSGENNSGSDGQSGRKENDQNETEKGEQNPK